MTQLEAFEKWMHSIPIDHDESFCAQQMWKAWQAAIEQKSDPVALPCCGYIQSAIKWNPFNGVVQCHNCGQTYHATPND